MTEQIAASVDAEEERTPDQLAPVAALGNRIASLDFIRGLAVMGILWANIVAFGQPFSAYMWPEAFLTPHGEVSNWMWIVQFVLIDGKMRGLFTLLFGAGLYLFMEKAWERGATRWLQVRRLFWLLLFGIVHFYLIWRGDILMLYSFAGFVALAFLRMSPKRQMVLGILGYLAGAVLYGAFMGPAYFLTQADPETQPELAQAGEGYEAAKAEALADDALERPIMTDGSYADFVQHNFAEHLTDPLFMLFIFGFETLPLMLIGMALYRWGLFDGRMNLSKQRMWGWIGLIGGTLLTVPMALWAKSTGFDYWANTAAFMAFSHLPRLPVVLGLAAILALVGMKASGWLAERISAAGRAAFTNYLGTSVLMMLVFHPWAGGLWGDLTRPGLYVVMLATWAVMLAWSKPWLDRYCYGPLEWLWRCLTYGRLFPLKR